MHTLMHRLAEAYQPLAGRNRLVEGVPLPVATPPAHRRLTLIALLAVLFGRRP
ncbi:MAG: hypothetical protein HOQ10_01245 [Frateuria sp.]|uniref:hypothetical protein n=1 Tax=Frateuria sp. TaxID=2211372 RepID=UPI00178FD752|nr:hypothetical protein [Frateuria sp.]NUO71328.1 hypothetical protein [Frateuria sp.]NUR23376.1 hypothetical protein [Frateuria sp.]